MAITPGNHIEIIRGDITRVQVDAIVNAANTTLLGGSGVDGAIHRVAGPDLVKESRTLGGCPTGSAKITRGYRLPAKHVIHAVGPVYRDGESGEPQLLAGCYRTAFQLAARAGCKTIAFPAISCGVYGYPIEEAAKIALNEALIFLHDNPSFVRIVFVLFDHPGLSIYQRTYEELLLKRARPST